MGLSLGIGVAISSKKKNFKTYVLLGMENVMGISIAAMLANHLKINNLTAILDNNGFQQTGTKKIYYKLIHY